MKDGYSLFYSKDGTVYPVVFTEQQIKLFEVFMLNLPGRKKMIIEPSQNVMENKAPAIG